jgi:hypothetical protein
MSAMDWVFLSFFIGVALAGLALVINDATEEF